MLVGFRRDLNLHKDFTLTKLSELYPQRRPTPLATTGTPSVDSKYILTPTLWKYLYYYAKKHQAKGNGLAMDWLIPKPPQVWPAHYQPGITRMALKYTYRPGMG